MSDKIYVNLKIREKKNPKNPEEATFLKGWRRDTEENYFVFTNVDKEGNKTRSLSKAPKDGKFTRIGQVFEGEDEYGSYLHCDGHKISENRFYDDGADVEGVEGKVKTDVDGNPLKYPSGDYILMEEMTLVIG